MALSWDNPGGDTITGYQILRLKRAVDDLGEFHVHEGDKGSAASGYVDGYGYGYVDEDVAVTVTDVNERQEITRVGGAPGYVPGNQDQMPVLARYTATDPEKPKAQVTLWSTSGTDGGDFVVNEQGELRFRYPPDYDRPADSNRGNDYTISVRASVGGYWVRNGILTGGVNYLIQHVGTNKLPIEQGGNHTVFDNADQAPRVREYLYRVISEPATNVSPTSDNLRRFFRTDSDVFRAANTLLMDAHQENRDNPRVAVKRKLWQELLQVALGQNSANDDPEKDWLLVGFTCPLCNQEHTCDVYLTLESQSPEEILAEAHQAADQFEVVKDYRQTASTSCTRSSTQLLECHYSESLRSRMSLSSASVLSNGKRFCPSERPAVSLDQRPVGGL